MRGRLFLPWRRHLHRHYNNYPQNPTFRPPFHHDVVKHPFFSTSNHYLPSFRPPLHQPTTSWQCISRSHGTMVTSSTEVGLKSLMGTTTRLPSFVRNFGVRMLHFSLQRRTWTPFYGAKRRFLQMNGWRSYMSTPDMVLYGLIGANVAVFILWRVADPTFMAKHFMISVPNIMNWRFHTLITSAFSHMDSDHIFTNMIGLYFFGRSIEQLFGPNFLLKMYIAGAVGGSLLYLAGEVLLQPSYQGIGRRRYSTTPALGASGATNAIMLFYIFLFPFNTIYLQFFIPVPAALVGAMLIGSDLWRMKQGDKRISGSAHIGGAIVAAVAYARVYKHWF